MGKVWISHNSIIVQCKVPYGTKIYVEFNFTVLQLVVECKIKIYRLDGNLLLNIAMTLSAKLGYHKIKIP